MILYYEDTGEGDVVVLLHGMAASVRYWDKLKSKIKNKRVITIDLMGFGQSQVSSASTFTYDDHIQSIMDTLEFLKINQPITLVGHSMGALIALRMAAEKRIKLQKLFLIGMPIYANAKAAQKAITNSKLRKRLAYYGPTSCLLCTLWCRVLRPISKRVAPLYLKNMPKIVAEDSVYHTWWSYSRSLKNIIENQHVTEDIRSLTVPTILVYGNNDLPVNLDQLNLEQINPRVQVEVLNGSHQIVHEQTERLIELMNLI